jgi:gamma-glutamylcyclotransferase (GGCT)/AIG2-like uncharacterized protein YtfP
MYHPERFKELLLKRNTPEFLSPQKSLVFVYGSLKRGHHNDYIMQGSEFICHTMTKGGNFKMVGMKGGYPGITWGNFRIVGEVYAVSDLHLELLDCLEDEGYHYKRHECRVRGLYEKPIWIYVLYQGFKDSIDPTENDRIIYDESDRSMEWSFPLSL